MVRERLILADLTDPKRRDHFGELIVRKFPFRIGREARIDQSDAGTALRENDLRLDELVPPFFVSRSHLEIGFINGAPYVRDVGSTAGTLINGRKTGGNHTAGTVMITAPETDIVLGGSNSPWHFKLLLPAGAAKPRLLVADDEVVVRDFLRRVFEKDYDVIEAGDGLEALRVCMEAAPDIAILDWLMPQIDGVKVCKNLKANLRTSRLPIVMVTGMVTSDNFATGIEAGADDYIPKPSDAKVIKTRVDAALARYQHAANVHSLTGLPSEAAFREEFNRLAATPETARGYAVVALSLRDLGRLEQRSGAGVADRLVSRVAELVWQETCSIPDTLAGQLSLSRWAVLTPTLNAKPLVARLKDLLDLELKGSPASSRLTQQGLAAFHTYFDLADG